MLTKICPQCKKEFSKPVNKSLKDWFSRSKYCSRKCYVESMKGKNLFGKYRFLGSGLKGRKFPERQGENNPRYSRVLLKCAYCGKEFSVINARKDTAKYCSIECRKKHRFNPIKNICKNCHKEFIREHNPKRKYDFCSAKCRAEYNSKKCRITLVCAECGKKFKVLQYYSEQKCCSKECADKFKDAGKTKIAIRLRNSKKYSIWRSRVFKRDNYTCQVCGQVGGILNAHHIKPFSDYPELRLDVNNGETLCVDCHVATETFGNGKRKLNDDLISQVEEG